MITILNTNFHEGYKVMKVTRVLIMMLVVVAGIATTSSGQVIPTNVWTDFGGTSCTVNGSPMPTGSIVQAFDQSGVLCGQRITASPGVYVATSVYGDDQFTPSVDEGCVANEVVVFKVNGIVASKLGPASDQWVGTGPIQLMNLATTQQFSINVVGPNEGTGVAGDPVVYTVTVENNGDGIDWINLDLLSSMGWSITDNQASNSFYLNPGETKQIEVTVHVPGNALVGQQDELTISVTSLFDPSADFNKVITTTVDQSTDVSDGGYAIPGQFSLGQNYPNPFNPETKISFSLAKTADVTLEVFDILGRKVSTLHSGYLGAGQHEFTWYGVDESGRQAASGIYFYRLSSNEFNLTRKMTLLK